MRVRRWGQTMGVRLALTVLVVAWSGEAAGQAAAVLTAEGRVGVARLYERCRECRVAVAEARRAAGARAEAAAPPSTDLGPDSFGGFAVVAGVVEAVEAVPIADGAGVVTAYRLRVTAVVKASTLVHITPGEALTVTRPGGELERAGGRVEVAVPGHPRLARTQEVRMVLLPAPGPGVFQEQPLPEALVLGGGAR